MEEPTPSKMQPREAGKQASIRTIADNQTARPEGVHARGVQLGGAPCEDGQGPSCCGRTQGLRGSGLAKWQVIITLNQWLVVLQTQDPWQSRSQSPCFL